MTKSNVLSDPTVIRQGSGIPSLICLVLSLNSLQNAGILMFLCEFKEVRYEA